MFVTDENWREAIKDIYACGVLSIDTEATGLKPYNGDLPFSLIVGTEKCAYYFNLDPLPVYPNGTFYLNEFQLNVLKEEFLKDKLYLFHNAKFDMAMLEQRYGIVFGGKVHDTMVTERVVHGSRPISFSLGETANRYGYEKSNAVDEYISLHGLRTKVPVPGKKVTEELKHFDQVPLDVIVPYGITDGVITRDIARDQRNCIRRIDRDANQNWPKLWGVYENEQKLVRTVYNMERKGLMVDRAYCTDQIKKCQMQIEATKEVWRKHTDLPFKKSGKIYAEIFKDEKLTYTAKGNAQFRKKDLKKFKHPLARALVKSASAKADMDKLNEFLYFSNAEGLLHGNFNQAQTTTGRFSSSAPNLQNIKKTPDDDSEDATVVRRAIVPRKAGNFLAMIDYDQMEYRLMLEYARAKKVVNLILEEGLDVHEATAKIAGIDRARAKNVNFGILYGQGNASLAASLDTTEAEARRIREGVLREIPEVDDFVRGVRSTAKWKGEIFNWLGRRYYYTRETEYKAPNGLIQGGCADIVKIAMNKTADFLSRCHFKTELVATIHDELVFEGPLEELPVLEKIKAIMETVYPSKLIPLTCGIDVSFKSLADKISYQEALKAS